MAYRGYGLAIRRIVHQTPPIVLKDVRANNVRGNFVMVMLPRPDDVDAVSPDGGTILVVRVAGEKVMCSRYFPLERSEGE
jgi:hypothetical protein